MPKSHKLELTLEQGETVNLLYKVICPDQPDSPCKDSRGHCWITDAVQSIGLDVLDVKSDIKLATIPFTGYRIEDEDVWLEIGGTE